VKGYHVEHVIEDMMRNGCWSGGIRLGVATFEDSLYARRFEINMNKSIRASDRVNGTLDLDDLHDEKAHCPWGSDRRVFDTYIFGGDGNGQLFVRNSDDKTSEKTYEGMSDAYSTRMNAATKLIGGSDLLSDGKGRRSFHDSVHERMCKPKNRARFSCFVVMKDALKVPVLPESRDAKESKEGTKKKKKDECNEEEEKAKATVDLLAGSMWVCLDNNFIPIRLIDRVPIEKPLHGVIELYGNIKMVKLLSNEKARERKKE